MKSRREAAVRRNENLTLVSLNTRLRGAQKPEPPTTIVSAIAFNSSGDSFLIARELLADFDVGVLLHAAFAAITASVGNQSTAASISCVTTPTGTLPGQRIIAETRMPEALHAGD